MKKVWLSLPKFLNFGKKLSLVTCPLSLVFYHFYENNMNMEFYDLCEKAKDK